MTDHKLLGIGVREIKSQHTHSSWSEIFTQTEGNTIKAPFGSFALDIRFFFFSFSLQIFLEECVKETKAVLRGVGSRVSHPQKHCAASLDILEKHVVQADATIQ